MVSIEVIAWFLLIFRLISVSFICMVLILQLRLFGTKIDFRLVPNLTKYQRLNVYRIRRVMFTLSLIILAVNLVPIVIDTLTIIGDNSIGRNPNIPAISIAYTFSNSLAAMFSAIMIWSLYKIAGFDGNKKK